MAATDDPQTQKPSRFQVVPLPGAFSRGRWKCCDFVNGDKTTLDKEDTSGNNKRIFVHRELARLESSSTIAITHVQEQNMDVSKSPTPTALVAQQQDVPSSQNNIVIIRKNGSTIVRRKFFPKNLNGEGGGQNMEPTSPATISPIENSSGNFPSLANPSTSTPISSPPTQLNFPDMSRMSKPKIFQVQSVPEPSSGVSATSPVVSPDEADPQLYQATVPLMASQQRPPINLGEPTFQVIQSSQTEVQRSASMAPLMTTPVPTEIKKPEEVAKPEEDQNQLLTSSMPIDNKIGQAMDLVKTHLTFAVREEMESLKSTIAELSKKVDYLTAKCTILERYAPDEVMENIADSIEGILRTASEEASAAQATTATMSQSSSLPQITNPDAVSH